MKRETTKTIIWIFCILVIVVLIAKIGFESGEYNCSECSVTFTNTLAGAEDYKFGEYQIKELFEDYIKTDSCLITWDPVQGYYNG
ncbi:hypothetical protein LCGC14_0622530 [marine sediment metagenome]|uniref:Uncharacterized protein n=1 Tax=marine sediment metagenome TaxID=412755 RepID=A0A0F9RNP0_9ZZZZ